MTNCEQCIWVDEITGACTGDESENCFQRQLEPEDMFKALYMLIYELGGQIEIGEDSFSQIGEEMKILQEFDGSIDKYILKTSVQPPKPSLIKVPKGIARRLIRN